MAYLGLDLRIRICTSLADFTHPLYRHITENMHLRIIRNWKDCFKIRPITTRTAAIVRSAMVIVELTTHRTYCTSFQK